MIVIIIFIAIIATLPIVLGYSFVENGNRMYSEFSAGGLQYNASGYNSTIVIGGFQTPFNSTIEDQEVKQGIYYQLLLTGIYTDFSPVYVFNFLIKDFGIEWIKINWTNG